MPVPVPVLVLVLIPVPVLVLIEAPCRVESRGGERGGGRMFSVGRE